MRPAALNAPRHPRRLAPPCPHAARSPNVLLDSEGAVKITDFGLALQEGGAATPRNRGATGSYRWMAPEVARRLGFRRAADVYSFGMVLFEVISHEIPFADVAALQAVAIVAVHGGRPPLAPGTPPAIAALTQACWHEDAAERPTFEAVAQALRAAEAALSDAEREWLDDPHGHPVYGLRAAADAQARDERTPH